MLRACRSSAGGLNHCGWVEELGGGGGWIFKSPAIASFSGVVGIVAFIYGFTEAFVAGF